MRKDCSGNDSGKKRNCDVLLRGLKVFLDKVRNKIEYILNFHLFISEMSNPTIRDFYKGRNILVTGGTGFMGKVLIEKLLYSIPDIGNIYILMRPKRGKSVDQRIEDMQRLKVKLLVLLLYMLFLIVLLVAYVEIRLTYYRFNCNFKELQIYYLNKLLGGIKF